MGAGQSHMTHRTDIAILGGGIIGASIAYHLASTGRAGTVTIIERDPTYEFAATPRANGGIRTLFSLPENIAMAQYGRDFYAKFAEQMAVDGEPAEISFKRQGYLFLSDQGDAAQMEENYHLQVRNGVEAELLDPAGIEKRFPSLAVDDLDLAVHSPNDAWIDPYAALTGFRAKARSLGATFLKGDIKGWEEEGGIARRVLLSDGSTVEADTFVLACGAWSREVAALIGLDLPVEPMSRESYVFKADAEFEPLPFLKSESDLAIRPEGDGFIGGIPDWSEPAGWNFELDPDHFENVVWPALVRRLPKMEKLKLIRSWRGHYARSTLDASPIIGRWSDGCSNVIIATGYSGHGIMHAPASGRAVSELVLDDRYQSLDLTCFGWERVPANRPYREKGIV